MRNIFKCKDHKLNAFPCMSREADQASYGEGDGKSDEEMRKGICRGERKFCREGGRGNKQGQVEGAIWGREVRAGQKGVGVIKTRRCVLASGSSYLLHF